MSLSLEDRLCCIRDSPLKPSELLSSELPTAFSSVQAAEAQLEDMLGVVLGHATAFPSSLSQDQMEAVELSSLWAQLAANARYDRVTEHGNWFGEYLSNLSTAGWIRQESSIHSSEFDRVDRADTAIIRAMEASRDPPGDIDLFKRMAKTFQWSSLGREAYTLYRRDTWKLDMAAFQIGFCQLNDSDVVWRVSSHFYQTPGFNGDILFFFFQADRVTWYSSSANLRLSVPKWNEIKEEIKRRVGDYVKHSIKNAPLLPL